MRPAADTLGCTWVCALVCALAFTQPVGAQPVGAQRVGAEPSPRAERSAADLAIARGRLDDAETMLFDASRRTPRDPSVRGALGNFLAARGHLKVGAVLLEEARRFGGDARAIDDRLAHVYHWIGDWNSVSALPGDAGRNGPRRARANYLAAHPPAITGPDSARVRLNPPGEAGVGRIECDMGGVALVADIDPGIEGLLLPAGSGAMAGVRWFGTQDGARLAVTDSIRIGDFRIRNVPAMEGQVAIPRVGLDVLAPLNPTFDMGTGLLTLRTTPGPAQGEPMPFLLRFPGVDIVTAPGSAPVGLTAAAGALLQGERWTFDLRHGTVRAQR